MDFIGDKLNSLTSEAVTGINELKRNRKRQSQEQQTIDKQKYDETPLSSLPNRQQQVSVDNNNKEIATGIYGFDLSRIEKGPLSGGVPFGGDSSPDTFAKVPAPVGFRPLLPQHEDAHKIPPSAPNDDDDDDDEHHHHHHHHQADEAKREQQQDDEGSSLSLYEGDTWSRMWFQRVMLLTLIRLILFVRKVYEDYSAFRLYNTIGLAGHCLISGATLLLPTIVFTIYRIARYLQIALPSVRASSAPQTLALGPQAQAAPAKVDEQPQHKSSRDSEDAQSRRALMSSPTDSIAQQLQGQQVAQLDDEDGLATARQTPTNLNDEFHDTLSEQQVQLDSVRPTSDLPSSSAKGDHLPTKIGSQDNVGEKSQEPRLESVDVNKLGHIADKHTTRIILGASEQLLHGILFIFWQLKRQVDIVGYLVERSCLWRKPKETEVQQLGRLRFSGDGLEWFQDFYAAFLAILVQVYSLGSYWAGGGSAKQALQKVTSSVSTLNSSPVVGGGAPSSSDLPEASVVAKGLGNLLSSILSTTGGGDLLIMSEIVVSCMVVVSLLVAVRRQDDGPLTLGLSMLGWGSIFAARIIVIALAFVHIGWQIMLPLVLCHIAAISVWIYKISLDSHNGKADESEEHRWAPPIEDARGQAAASNKPADGSSSQSFTSTWSTMEHLMLICQVVTLFAIPSLFYWPIMFNLKLHARPFKYLALIMSENFLLIAAIWYVISSAASTSAQWYLLGTIGACSIVGFIFIALYIACKPSLTEYFARADEIINEAEKSGIYYEFCSRVFRMPDLTKNAFTRLMNQQEHTVVEVVEEDQQSLTEVQLD